MIRALIIAIAFALSGCASQPHAALSADLALTGAGLAVGYAEMNPLALVGIPLTIGILDHADTLPPAQAAPIRHSVAATRWGAASWNLATIAGLVPKVRALIAVGIGLGVWNSGEAEREALTACAIHDALAGRKHACNVTPV